MATPFLAEIRIFSSNFAPRGWALCNGQLLPINQNQALFSLLGTTYGGNGQTNFALPNLRGRTPIHFGAGHTLGEAAGAEFVTLTTQQMPTHNHAVRVSLDDPNSNSTSGSGNYFGAAADGSQMYFTGAANTVMQTSLVSNVGGSQPHENRQPFLALTFCIALQGIFPSQN
jgi:microcystin-dependent protein